MFEINQKVVHAREGLSTVVAITEMGGRSYYIVHSDRGGGENIYVLIDNVANLIRPILSIDEAKEIIKYMKTVKAEFISNTKQRRDQYKKRLLSGSVQDLAYLARQLYFYNYYNANGQLVKLGPTDVQLLKDAEQILYDELAISFGINRPDIADYISGLLD